MRIALDAMGGDFGIEPNIPGALKALETHSDLEIWLVGDQIQIEERLSQLGATSARLRVVAAEGVAGMEEKPSDVLLRKPNCSIAVCWKLMAAREVDAVVSAGSTGAVVATGLRSKLFLKGVKRPGIAVVLPTLTGRSVLMDVGANPQARPDHLAQYAIMAAIYAKDVLGIADPSVGLMNIGSEDGKGNDLVRDTHALLTRVQLKGRYLGNVEGRSLYLGEADVIVCEGFVGNVVLKVSEGLADMLFRTIPTGVITSLNSEKELAARVFEEIGRKYSWHESGGAPLLGVDGICMICHGSSTAHSIANALSAAIAFRDRRVNEQIVEEIARHPLSV